MSNTPDLPDTAPADNAEAEPRGANSIQDSRDLLESIDGREEDDDDPAIGII
jgi:hypothetical protein